MRKKTLTVLSIITLFFGIVSGIIVSSCEKNEVVEGSWQDYYVDSIGIKHNVVLKPVYEVIKTKKGMNLEEIYNLVVEFAIEEYNIPLNEIPKFSDISDDLIIILDTTISFVDKFKQLNPDYSELQIDYLYQVEDVISSNYDVNTVDSYITSIENDIIINTTLTDSKKGELINITDVAKNSYIFWENELISKTDPEPNGWWIVGADVIGAVAGAWYIGGGGAIVLGAAASASMGLYLIGNN
jgi:hypothetical protein